MTAATAALARLRPLPATLWAYYTAVMAALVAVYVLAPLYRGSSFVVVAVGIGALAAVRYGARIHHTEADIAWRLILLGQVALLAAYVVSVARPHDRFPSAADAIHLIVYPALFGGLVLLVRRRDPGGLDRASSLDSLVITVGFSLLFWVFLVVPNFEQAGSSTVARVVSLAYPTGDVLLLAAGIRRAVQPTAKSPAFYLLFSGIVALLASDFAAEYGHLHSASQHHLLADGGIVLFLALSGVAALHPSMRELERPMQVASAGLTTTRLGVLALACLSAPSIYFVEEIRDTDLRIVIGASGILFLLVVLRVAGLARHQEKAAAREVTLRTAGLALVEAVGRASVHEEAVSSATGIAGENAHVRLVRWTESESGAEVVAASGGGAWKLSKGTAEWIRTQLRTQARVVTSVPSDPVAAALGLGAAGPTIVVRLSVADQDQGALVVGSALALSSDVVDSLEALASQVSLALESASLAENLHRQKSEARFRSLVAHATDLITVLDEGGVVTYQSPSIESLLGYQSADVEGRPFGDLLDEADRPLLAELIDGSGLPNESRTFECRLCHADGRPLLFEIRQTVLLEEENVRGIVLNGRDVSERKAFEDQLAHQAFHDPVTGLANRALFADRVGVALRSTVRTGSLIAVMFIDLDDFKMVNDSLGHQAGDSVLGEVARRLQQGVRPGDTVARFGGDEFAILLDGIVDSNEAVTIADRLLEALEEVTTVDGQEVYPRASIGICTSDEDLFSQDVEELLRNADLAMYMAKRDTKGGYRLFEPSMHKRILERLELRSKLQVALEHNELEVFYQPVVHIDGGTRYGVEALLRWHHPEKGLVAPGHFIPPAEETGLIVPIGAWVIEQACLTAAALQERLSEPLRMSVNLSVKQLQSESIVDVVHNALEASRLPPESLVLEVTETVMLADADVAVQRLHELKELGIKIAMDDFGTGYSSLSYLSRLPVDILKMDRSFLADDIHDTGLAAAIMAIGDRLGLEVVAEGIERHDQIESLQSLGFALGQGFLFGRPMPSESLDRHFAKRRNGRAKPSGA